MYFPLHLHTTYSTSDGLRSPKDIAKQVNLLGLLGAAITDHGRLSGYPLFYKEFKSLGLVAVPGIEAYVYNEILKKRTHLILLAGNQQGLKNLYKISSKSFENIFEGRPCVSRENLEKYNEGIICGSACMGGELQRFILADDNLNARKIMDYYYQVFNNERYYLEFQNQNDSININHNYVTILNWFLDNNFNRIPIVATADSHYSCSSDKEVHEIVMNSTGKSDMLEAYLGDLSILPEEEFLKKLQLGIKEDVYPFLNATNDIYSRLVDMGVKEINPFRTTIAMPRYNSNNENISNKEIITEICEKEIRRRVPANKRKEYITRYKYELDIIDRKGFSEYFLIVADYVAEAKRKGFLKGPSRGSAGGSLVAHCLGITDMDPIEYGLLFERMLHEDRPENKPPDFDLDFDPLQREALIGYISEKYGSDKISRVGTFQELKIRGVIKEIGRALELSPSIINDITTRIPDMNKQGNPTTIEDLVSLNPSGNYEYPEMSKYFQDTSLDKLWETTNLISGMGIIKSEGIHASGIVISSDPIEDWCPTRLAMTDIGLVKVTQYDMNILQDIGFIKFDFLKLTTITLLYKIIQLIKKNHNKTINLEDISLNSSEVYDLYASGNTQGVFQLSAGQGIRDFFSRLKPKTIKEIGTGLALYRPGPMDYITTWASGKKHSSLEEFLLRRDKRSKVENIHPIIDPILESTYGLLIFQEQIISIAKVIGYSAAESDKFREGVGKKDKAKVDSLKPIFIEKATEKLGNLNIALSLWNTIVTYARYGFNVPHAIAYAILSYYTAYFKKFYPTEFYCASIDIESKDSRDNMIRLISDAKTYSPEIKILPPSLTLSSEESTVEKKNIRLGFNILKGVGETGTKFLQFENNQRVFSSYSDFINRIDFRKINGSVLEKILLTGMGENLFKDEEEKRIAITSIPYLKNYFEFKDKMGSSNLDYFSTFNDMINTKIAFYSGRKSTEFNLKQLEKWKEIQSLVGNKVIEESLILKAEKDLFGFYISSNPLDYVSNEYSNSSILKINEITSDIKTASLIVLIDSLEKKTSKKTKTSYAIARLTDPTDSIDAMVFYGKNVSEEIFVEGNILKVRVGITHITEQGSKKYRVISASLIRGAASHQDNTNEIILDISNYSFDRIFSLISSIESLPYGDTKIILSAGKSKSLIGTIPSGKEHILETI